MSNLFIYMVHGSQYLIIEETQNILSFKIKDFLLSAEFSALKDRFSFKNIIHIKTFKIKEIPLIRIHFFELDGSEFLFCGNGVLSVSQYLYEKYKLKNVKYITISQMLVSTLVSRFDGIYLNMGRSVLPPSNYLPNQITVKQYQDSFYLVGFPLELSATSGSYHVQFSGIYTLTGEPHVVIFGEMLSSARSKDVFNQIFQDTCDNGYSLFTNFCLKINNPQWFAQGVNVNLARILDKNVIEYRCFERGINQEAVVCCTGATAVAAVAYNLQLVNSGKIQIQPKLTHDHQANPDTKLLLNHKRGEWWLKCKNNPQLVWIHE